MKLKTVIKLKSYNKVRQKFITKYVRYDKVWQKCARYYKL